MKKMLCFLTTSIFLSSFMPRIENKYDLKTSIVGHSVMRARQEIIEIISAQNGIQSHLFFNLSGEVVKCQRYYKEKDLSPFIAAKVKYHYPPYKIFGITELTNDQGVIYTIVLENTTSWIYVESNHSGLLKVKKRFKKA